MEIHCKLNRLFTQHLEYEREKLRRFHFGSNKGKKYQ